MEDLNKEIRALIDKEAIRELANLYCQAADRHDHELMRSLYHEDAEDDHGSFFRGKAMEFIDCLLYTSPSPRDGLLSRMPSSA